MGDPKFPRRRYDTPSHPWNAERIAEEKTLVRKYGLKNKREVWKAQTKLRSFRGTARLLLSQQHTGLGQVEKESKQLLRRLNRMGYLSQEATLDDVLGLGLENVLTRRLQTVVYLKGFASTPKQARQFIVHGHVTINGRKVTVPSYPVPRDEEDAIELNAASPVADPAHPVRAKPDTLGSSRSEPPAHRERPLKDEMRDGDATAPIPLGNAEEEPAEATEEGGETQ
jgi:small subunit ribosomal protein S4